MKKNWEKVVGIWIIIKIFVNLFFVMEPKILYHTILVKMGKQEKADKFGYKIIKKWAHFATNAAKMNITVEGMEKVPTDRPVLITPNHQSYADIPVLLRVFDNIDIAFLMRKSLNKFFAIEQISKILKCVPIDQDDMRDSLKGINKTAEQIKDGLSMVVFPEGRRTFSNTPEEFKNGAFKIVQKTGVTVVPVYMHNIHMSLEGNDFIIKPNNITIKILDPIETTEMSRGEVKELHDRVHKLILEESKKFNN